MLRLVTDKLRTRNFDILCELEFATHPDTLLQWLAAAKTTSRSVLNSVLARVMVI
jgi:hypothetical protein